MRGSPLRRCEEGVLMAVRVQPNAAANRIDGIDVAADGSPRLKLRVTAAPDKGKANKAAVKLLAKACGVPPSSIAVAAGATQRNKTLLLQGESETLYARLDEWLRTGGS
jgi:uncharacterized protein (TIGR00251 family)